MFSRAKLHWLFYIVIISIPIFYMGQNILSKKEIYNIDQGQKLSVIDGKATDNNLLRDNKINPIKNKAQSTIYYCSEYYINDFNSYYSQGYLGKAMQITEEILKENPNDTEAIVNLSIVYKDLTLQESLYNIYCYIIERSPNNIEVYETISNIMIDNSYINNALDILYKGIEHNYDNTMFYYLLGDKLASLGRYEEAVNIYNCAIKIDPKDHAAYYNLAIIYSSMGYDELAAKAYSVSAELLKEMNIKSE